MSSLQPSITPSAPSGLADGGRLPRLPGDVLADPALTAAEKREILAAWASDDHVVPDAPSLRRLDDGAVVGIDEILGALRTLDLADAGRAPSSPAGMSPGGRSTRRRRAVRGRLRILIGRRDDDDDPPPSPAAALPFEVAMVRRRRWEGCAGPEPAAA